MKLKLCIDALILHLIPPREPRYPHGTQGSPWGQWAYSWEVQQWCCKPASVYTVYSPQKAACRPDCDTHRGLQWCCTGRGWCKHDSLSVRLLASHHISWVKVGLVAHGDPWLTECHLHPILTSCWALHCNIKDKIECVSETSYILADLVMG